MSGPQYDFFTHFENAWDARSLSSYSASSSTLYSSSFASTANTLVDVLHLNVPLPYEDDPPVHDISLTPTTTTTTTVSSDEEVYVEDPQSLGYLRLPSVESLRLPSPILSLTSSPAARDVSLVRVATTASHVSVSNVEYLGRLHLTTMDSLEARRGTIVEKGEKRGRMRRVVKKVLRKLGKGLVQLHV